MRYTIETRSQRSRGSSSHKFGGPDRYVAVVIAPEGVKVPHALNVAQLRKLGIEVRRIGEYYSRHTGKRSAYARAMLEAHAWVQGQVMKETEAFHVGDRIRFRRIDGAMAEDTIRKLIVQYDTLEPYARTEWYPAAVLTEHSWTSLASIQEVKREGEK